MNYETYLRFKASACRLSKKAENDSNVRAIDERVKHVNGVFSLENTESEYKKEEIFAGQAGVEAKLYFKVL